jgi:uncharacterized Tic20 family protein
MADTITGLLPVAMVLGPLAIMASRTLAPMKAKPEGKVLLEVRLGVMQRALSQRANVAAVCVVVALAGGLFSQQRAVSPVLGLLALLVMFAMLTKRQTLVFTSRGVMPHGALFRSWKDFEGYRLGSNKLTLRSGTRLASLSLFFPTGAREDVEKLVARQLGQQRRQRG